MRVTRDHRILAVTAALAIGAPVGAARWLDSHTARLAARLGAVGEVDARIGGIDADLTGTIRLTDVALGSVFAADEIEASVALESLLSGELTADEVRVAGPRVAITVDRDGGSDLARLVRRFGRGDGTSPRRALRDPPAVPSTRGESRPRVRRIVVSEGSLAARVTGLGDIAADGVALVPEPGGVRLITGRVRVRGATGGVRGDLELGRSAAEIALPDVEFGRVLGVAGRGSITIGERTLALRELAVGRLGADGSLEARGLLDDHGAARELSVELVPPARGARGDAGFALVVRGERLPLAPLAAFAPRALALDDARASGEVRVRGDDTGLHIELDGAVEDLRMVHPTLARQPLAIDAALRAAATVAPTSIAVQRAEIRVGDATWSASGWLRRGAPTSGQVDVQLAPATCAGLLGSLPAEVREPVDGLLMTGTFGARARLAIDLAAPPGHGVQLDTRLDNRCVVHAEPAGADVARLAVPSEHTFGDGTRAIVGAGEPSWIELRRLRSHIPGAFVSAEDGRFFSHPGFDVVQIARSLEIDLREGRLARGGSTISQQLVKNAFLSHRRTLDRKLQEVLLTWRLEARLDKKTILERYLNIIELGPRVFGLRAAAMHWFQISPRELSVRQAAFLAALTAEPTTMTRRIRTFGGLDPASAARVDIILRAMRRDGVIDTAGLEAARADGMRFASSALRRDG
jgi:hypothetical protein